MQSSWPNISTQQGWVDTEAIAVGRIVVDVVGSRIVEEIMEGMHDLTLPARTIKGTTPMAKATAVEVNTIV